jgi:hypothetical protein
VAYSPAAGKVLGVWDDRRKHSWSDLDVTGATLNDRFLRRPAPVRAGGPAVAPAAP